MNQNHYIIWFRSEKSNQKNNYSDFLFVNLKYPRNHVRMIKRDKK